MTLDRETAELERRVGHDPDDAEAVARLAGHHVRAGRAVDAARVGARWLARSGPGPDAPAVARAADLPTAILPDADAAGTVLVAIGPDDEVLPIGALPFGTHTFPVLGDGVALGIPFVPPANDLEGSLAGAATSIAAFGVTGNGDAGVDGLPPLPGCPWELPAGFVAHAVAVVEGPDGRRAIYAGGEDGSGEGELLQVRDASRGVGPWRPIAVPDEVGEVLGDRKALDALIVDVERARLYAVDDIIYPKWLVVYDIAEPLEPRVDRVTEIPAHYTYETIRRAVAGDRFFAVLSHGAGRAGRASCLGLLDRETLQERHSVLEMVRPADEGPIAEDEPVRGPTWHDVAFVEERLVVAAGNDGVLVLDLEQACPPGATPSPVDVRRLRRCGAPLAQDEEAFRVVALPGAPRRVVVAVARQPLRQWQFRPESFRWEVVPIDPRPDA